MIPDSGHVGEVKNAADGADIPIRLGPMADQIKSDLHGRLYELNRVGRLYSGGMGLTAINNATFTTGTLGATCTPICGVWNPPTSGVNLEILKAMLAAIITAATSTGPGGFSWAYSTGNVAISTGSTPLNRKSLVLAGSMAKHFANVALTGLTNNLVVAGASSLGGGNSGNFSFVGTAAGPASIAPTGSEEMLEGSWIVPPGGVLALLAHTTPVAHSAASHLIWGEVPVS